MGELLNTAQVCALIPGRKGDGIHRATLHRWVKDGVKAPDGSRIKLPSFLLGGHRMYRREDVELFIELASGSPSHDEATAQLRAHGVG